MHYFKLAVAILSAVLFGTKLEDMINKYLKPTDDFMVKAVHYGAPVATGIGTLFAMNMLFGGKV
jgi:hypothetical protein